MSRQITELAAEATVAKQRDRAVVRLEDVRKTYQMGSATVHALNGISLTFERGTFWAILGPSGSGKSTMLNLLGCLDRPTSGRYLLEGQDIDELDDAALSELRLRHLGFVFQSFNLIPELTMAENIALPLFYLGWSHQASAARAAELAETVGLGERLDHRPMELSGGQQQRVAIARALSNDPAVLLADEPTGNLDTTTGQQIMELLCSLHEQGKTILMVTHEPAVAAHASHQLHLRDGVVDRVEGKAI